MGKRIGKDVQCHLYALFVGVSHRRVDERVRTSFVTSDFPELCLACSIIQSNMGYPLSH